jgi:hypothetical protein
MPAVAHTSVGSSWRRCSKTRSRLPLSRTNQCSETAPSADKSQVQLPVALRKPIRAITSLDHQICTAPKEEQKTRARSRARIRGSSLLKLPCRRTHHACTWPASVRCPFPRAQAGTDKPHHQTTTNNAARLLYPASPAERARRELSEPEKEEKYSRRGRAPRCSSAASLRRLAATARSQSRPHLPDCLFPAFGAALCMARNGPARAFRRPFLRGRVASVLSSQSNITIKFYTF